MTLLLLFLTLIPVALSIPAPVARDGGTTTTVASCNDWVKIYAAYWAKFPQCHSGTNTEQCCQMYDFMDKSIRIFETELNCSIENISFFQTKYNENCRPGSGTTGTTGGGGETPGSPGMPVPAPGVGQGGHGDEDGIIILNDGTTQINDTPTSNSGTTSPPATTAYTPTTTFATSPTTYATTVGHSSSSYSGTTGVHGGHGDCNSGGSGVCGCCSCCCAGCRSGGGGGGTNCATCNCANVNCNTCGCGGGGCTGSGCGGGGGGTECIGSGCSGGGGSGGGCTGSGCGGCTGSDCNGGCTGSDCSGGCTGSGCDPDCSNSGCGGSNNCYQPSCGCYNTHCGCKGSPQCNSGGGGNNQTQTDDEGKPLSFNRACFAGDSMVQMGDGTLKMMKDIELGDAVATGSGRRSKVFFFTHRTANVQNLFVTFLTKMGTLSTTPGHFVHSSRGTVQAREVQVGDGLLWGDGTFIRVDKVGSELKKGLYNPQTSDGDIVVDGFTVSTYTVAVERTIAHGLLAPIRAAHAVCGECVRRLGELLFEVS